MPPRRKPEVKKLVDDTARVRCKSGIGVIREEVWVDDKGKVAKYNLTFINHHLYSGDNGRVLGYDNAHSYHERHFKGTAEVHSFTSYEDLVAQFLEEVTALREE
jgi:Family of unknown function (DUF6516)